MIHPQSSYLQQEKAEQKRRLGTDPELTATVALEIPACPKGERRLPQKLNLWLPRGANLLLCVMVDQLRGGACSGTGKNRIKGEMEGGVEGGDEDYKLGVDMAMSILGTYEQIFSLPFRFCGGAKWSTSPGSKTLNPNCHLAFVFRIIILIAAVHPHSSLAFHLGNFVTQAGASRFYGKVFYLRSPIL